jgi:superfamily II DNA or RNA helicase
VKWLHRGEQVGVFPHASDVVQATFGYHPMLGDLAELLAQARFARLVAVGGELEDVLGQVGSARVSASSAALPRGLYWFCGLEDPLLMVVTSGGPSGDGACLPVAEVEEDSALALAYSWAEHHWDSGTTVPDPKFALHEDVVTVPAGQETVVRRRRFVGGRWTYEVRLDRSTQIIVEAQLDRLPEAGDHHDWIRAGAANVQRFGATLTRAKLEGQSTDTVFSFRATRTVFRPYQFKPVLKLLQTGSTRILVADEVGLGKTIEAGLIWTELEARYAANRVLVIAPSALVPKWQEEMWERFNFTLAELSGNELDAYLRNFMADRLPRRHAYVASLERLRTWDGLATLADAPPQFDLIIVDEAHSMRNPGTRSNALGQVLSEWGDTRVFLTATPVNLGSQDLATMLELLAPEDFDDAAVLEKRLEPNGVLHAIERLLVDRSSTPGQRLALLDELADLPFGRPITRRPDFPLLRALLGKAELAPGDVVEARRLLAEFNALSSVITRTRKVEVDEQKALRSPILKDIVWTPAERRFYEEYVRWCSARAEAADRPLHFAMQMPLRLASACLPQARAAVLGRGDASVRDEDAPAESPAGGTVPPHRELLAAARALPESVDSKFDQLLPMVQELVAQERRSLLFTFSRPTLAYLARRLSPHARIAVMHGDVSRQDRRQIMADFRAGLYDILLANRVASEGLDFEFCSAVINYDIPWNPMEIEQRIGRIDRIGQAEEKILVVNFFNDETIDERILRRVLVRIGVFERAIGALEPIVQSHLPQLQEAVFDFSLTDAQRTHKADQILNAIEASRSEAERLAEATSDLLVSGDVEVAGLERDLVTTGRYVGQQELAALLHDWALTAGARGVSVSPDGLRLSLRGNPTMAKQLRDVAQRGQRMHHETEALAGALQNEMEIHLLLDAEAARTGPGDLLTATHPLVLAATAVPGHRQARLAHVQIDGPSTGVDPGRYAVLLAAVNATGPRPVRETWGSAATLDGRPAPEDISHAVLAALASGRLRQDERFGDRDLQVLGTGLDLAAEDLRRRHVAAQDRLTQDAHLLVESRRISLEDQLRRKLDAIDRRIETSRQRGHTRLQGFEGQRRRARERHEELLSALDGQRDVRLDLSWLAACSVEVTG